MKPEALHKIAEALQKSHHQHLGITPQPPQPPHAPMAALLERPEILSFTRALDAARGQWPDTDLCLIGAQGALGPTNIDDPTDTLPPASCNFSIRKACYGYRWAIPKTKATKSTDKGDQID
jgi:hypothetical protein